MLDFLEIAWKSPRKDVVEIYPKFLIKKSNDLMIRGGTFYAIWVEEKGLWSTDPHEAVRLIDEELAKYHKANASRFEGRVVVKYLYDASSGSIDAWNKYCQKQSPDNYKDLDETLIFANTKIRKRDYASKRLTYNLEQGSTTAWDEIVSTLYSPEEQHKIEWAIGSVVAGASKTLQKFFVFYGASGTGKSTILNVIGKLFEGYTSTFDSRALGSATSAFALEAFRHNPLVALQHDGDLSRIEDNTRLNSLVSHEIMTVNEKFKSTYESRFICLLFMGTNKPVKITDAKSGLLRRLIDISPTGDLIPTTQYHQLMNQVEFELGAIAFKCRDIFNDNPHYYDAYVPKVMLGATNDFYNFVQENWLVFKNEDETTLKAAWEMYKVYCEEARVPYPYSQKLFKEELKNYFDDFSERATMSDGTRVRNLYSGFKVDKFEPDEELPELPKTKNKSGWLDLQMQPSIFDSLAATYPAQYANEKDIPTTSWDKNDKVLADLDTSNTHYVLVPEQHIVIDLDIRVNGEKNFAANVEEANKWPPTYAEVSKGGNGIHLHYIYSGDVKKLSSVYDDQIEVKTLLGKASLRRKLTRCNDIQIAHISSGLPLKEESPTVNKDYVMNEKILRTMIKRNLNKEYHSNTAPSVQLIKKIIDDYYKKGIPYDISDLRPALISFAASSTNQAEECLKIISKLPYVSNTESEGVKSTGSSVIFDVEVYPNLCVVCWKKLGENNPVVPLINPAPKDIESLLGKKLIGFNCRRYDNHILYALLIGYNQQEIYTLSQRIIKGERGAFFGQAYDMSYTDIYDFSSKKQSLKKFEVELGIRHLELGLSWDQPVPENLWPLVVEYCSNDVLATEKVFLSPDRQADFTARKILANLAGMKVNDTTNSLTTRIIFGRNRNPQDQFNYRDLAQPVTYR